MGETIVGWVAAGVHVTVLLQANGVAMTVTEPVSAIQSWALAASMPTMARPCGAPLAVAVAIRDTV